MWAEFLGARNPIWRPAAILNITFSTIWPTVMRDLWIMGYFGPRNWLVMLVSSFDLVLTFKSNMAPGGHLENGIFDTLVPSAEWLMLWGVFGGKEIIYDVSLMIRLGLDLKMQDDHHVANGLCKLRTHWTARLAMSTIVLFGNMVQMHQTCYITLSSSTHLEKAHQGKQKESDSAQQSSLTSCSEKCDEPEGMPQSKCLRSSVGGPIHEKMKCV